MEQKIQNESFIGFSTLPKITNKIGSRIEEDIILKYLWSIKNASFTERPACSSTNNDVAGSILRTFTWKFTQPHEDNYLIEK